MRNSEAGFTPAASQATSSSRDCSGVISIWSRAIENPDLGDLNESAVGQGGLSGRVVPQKDGKKISDSGRFDRTRRVAGSLCGRRCPQKRWQKSQDRCVSSGGRAVSCGGQLDFAAGAAQPVQETAELQGIGVGQLRADMSFDCG